jgi:hypothetical protein
VSRRTSPVDQTEGRRFPLTPRSTLLIGSLGFVYTEPVESIVGRTFARPPRPNVLTSAAGHAVFVRGFSDETIMAMLGPNPTLERFRLVAYSRAPVSNSLTGSGVTSGGCARAPTGRIKNRINTKPSRLSLSKTLRLPLRLGGY